MIGARGPDVIEISHCLYYYCRHTFFRFPTVEQSLNVVTRRKAIDDTSTFQPPQKKFSLRHILGKHFIHGHFIHNAGDAGKWRWLRLWWRREKAITWRIGILSSALSYRRSTICPNLTRHYQADSHTQLSSCIIVSPWDTMHRWYLQQIND